MLKEQYQNALDNKEKELEELKDKLKAAVISLLNIMIINIMIIIVIIVFNN